MSPEKSRKPARQEFEVVRRSQVLGRPPQRKIVRERPDDFTDADITAATHGDEPSANSYEPPPREDRAG